MRISNSFSEGEVQILEFVLQTLLRGGTPTMATRHKDFPSLYRKVMTMKSRLADKMEHKADKSQQSSVGTVDAVQPAEPANTTAEEATSDEAKEAV